MIIKKNMSKKKKNCQLWDLIFSAWGQRYHFNSSNLGFGNEKGRLTHPFSRPMGHNIMLRSPFCISVYEDVVVSALITQINSALFLQNKSYFSNCKYTVVPSYPWLCLPRFGFHYLQPTTD